MASDGSYSSTAWPATVGPFLLDQFEVTVGRFRAFVAAGQGTRQRPPAPGAGLHPNVPASGWAPSWDAELAPDRDALVVSLKCAAGTWTDAPGPNEDLPVNCVDWYEAAAFCAWDGGYLPTEAEWNFAAAGGAEQRAYPWSIPASSTDIDCGHANYAACPRGGADRVGARPAGNGRWGHADLAGNVFSWCLDWHAPTYPPGSCDDCANLVPATFRVIRSGGYNVGASDLRTGYRDDHDAPPGARYASVGIRCARPIP